VCERGAAKLSPGRRSAVHHPPCHGGKGRPPGGEGAFETRPAWKAPSPLRSVSALHVAGGKRVLDEKKSWADTFWHRQKEQFDDFKDRYPGDPAAVEPPDTEDGGCVFSYSPSESAKDYRDALWIQAFNGAPVGYIN